MQGFCSVREAVVVAKSERGLTIDVSALYRMVNKGYFPKGTVVLRLGKRIKINKTGFLQWIDDGGAQGESGT